MRIVIAPDKFKEALPATQVCDAIARGVRDACPDAHITCIPMADGGEGTVDALVAATGGTFRDTRVTGPLGEPVVARWGLLGGADTPIAVIEMAAASGLAIVPPDRRNPTRTTTRGTGELIRAALDADAGRIVLGIGGSATNDGGAGAAQALGVRFLDDNGVPLTEPLTGGSLERIARIDLSARDPRIAAARIDVACDVTNPLCGPNGAAAIYGPQKGATPEQVQQLDRALAHLARIITHDLGRNVADLPGAGAAGGLGAGLVAFLDARLQRGVELVMDAVRLREAIAGADLVITGEGRLDAGSMMGKTIAGVARAAKDANVPAIALVGATGPGAEDALAVLEAFHVISADGLSREEALARTAENLRITAARIMLQRRAGRSV